MKGQARPTTTAGSHSETLRQVVHISMGVFALLLRWIAWWHALVLAAAALAFNLFVLPRVGHAIYRPGDRERGVHGILFYPLTVLLLLVMFPTRLPIAAAAWGILAAGDGMATIVGRAVGGPRWPWNRDKTLAGSAALALFGGTAGAFLLWWCIGAAPHRVDYAFGFYAPFAAAIVAALVETMPVRLDDNLSVGLTAGATLWLASVSSATSFELSGSLIAARLPLAVGVNGVVALAGYAARAVSTSGAICGACIGIVIFASLGWPGWGLLMITFIAASVSSRLGIKRKTLLGIAEERGGRRGAGNAIANTGVAAIAAWLCVAGREPGLAAWAFAASLAAGGSDTIASEIGKAWGRTTWLITSLGRVPPGTPGAMSLEGTAAGVLGALMLGGAAIALRLVPPVALMPIVIASTAGALVESALGATLEGPGILNNDMLNFINTGIAAFIAAAWAAKLA